MKRTRLLAIVGAVIVAVVIGVWSWQRSAGAPGAGNPAANAGDSAAPANARRAVHAGARPGATSDDGDPGALPASLDGTEADGAVTADAGGHLIVTIELRRLFDHFLAATGEEPLATIRKRIIAALHERLPEPAASEAIEILDRYLGYRDAARQLAESASASATPSASDLAAKQVAQLAQIHDLRAKWFTPVVVRAFFADEEAAITAAFARRDVLTDRSLSDAERAQKLADLDAKQPARERAAREAAMAPLNEMTKEAAMRAAGATDADIAAARTEAFGSDAAARLATLDQQHAEWNARLAQFRADRDALFADSSLSDADRQARLDALLARFSPQERIRVEAIEHIKH